MENGFHLKGKITHVGDESKIAAGPFRAGDEAIDRSLFIHNDLFTISSARIKINALSDLKTIKTIDLFEKNTVDFRDL